MRYFTEMSRFCSTRSASLYKSLCWCGEREQRLRVEVQRPQERELSQQVAQIEDRESAI